MLLSRVQGWESPSSVAETLWWSSVPTSTSDSHPAGPALWGTALGPCADLQVGSVEVQLLELLKDEPLQGFRGEVSQVTAVPPP